MAGAMPLASTVIILLIGVEAKRLTNSTPMDFIRIGSIWWLMSYLLSVYLRVASSIFQDTVF